MFAFFYHFSGSQLGRVEINDAKGHRVARITANDLMSLGRYSVPAPPPATVKNIGRNAFGTHTIINSTSIDNLHLDAPSGLGTSISSPAGGDDEVAGGGLLSQPPLVGPLTRADEIQRLLARAKEGGSGPSWITTPKTQVIENHQKQISCGEGCQLRRMHEQSLATLTHMHGKKGNANKQGKHSYKPCDQACRIAKMKNHALRRGGYSSRVQVENVTLPNSWTVTRELVDRLSARRNHVHEVCRKYNLNRSSDAYKPNAWEFLINAKYGLVWCNVFKAASSTWFYNFNLLAGFTEQQLLNAKETPIQLARKRYPRPTVEELQKAMNSTPQALSFMIARHPLERLVSGFRDKILSGNRYYSRLSRTILRQYKNMGPGEEKDNGKSWNPFGKSAPKNVLPSFPQFVQFLLDEAAKGHKLDEHWTPMNTFCTPCLVDFDVFAKVSIR
ncbi:hypothetical protein SK128_015280 [Halocaridina rubra]|uniref:Carbohydrate sulfotransferase n=1 Tax=Halocaridina rubra TaxID=373956 RepID=A0AAN9AC28_HALRR